MFARISALLLIISYLLLATPVYAQNASNPSTPKESKPTLEVPQVNSSPIPYTLYPIPSYVSPTSPLYTDLFVHNMFHSFSCLAIGQSVIGQPCLTYQITKNTQGMLQGIPVLSQTNLQGGALGTVTSVIAALYQNPPVRTADYLASVGQDIGVVKEARAQVFGSGAQVLDPILKLWQVSRNISYVLLIIIFLVIGLMVMFRNKLNPQTVITAQAALPGLVIGLIMITFSYFFAGLISDMAFIGTNIVGYYFTAAQSVPVEDLVQKTESQSVLNIFSKFVGVLKQDDVANAIDSIFNSFTPEVQNYLRIFAGIIAFQFSNQVGGAIPVYGAIIGPILGLVSAVTLQTNISGILGFFVSLITVAILIYTMLKLLLRLISNYLTIIFLTLTAPFQFLIAALPGRQGIATNWFLNMLANILAFPAVMAVFYFVNYLVGSGTVINSPFTVGPNGAITGAANFPLLGGINLSFLRIVVAFGALVATPSIPEIINRSIGKIGPAAQLLGQELGGGIRSGQGYTTQTAQRGFGAAQSIGTGIGGETTLIGLPGGGYARRPVKPGLIHIFRRGP